MRKLFKNWFFPLLILGLTLFIAFRNYTPGTWLLGWDNLVPELNLKLNITRSLSAVWQEYQGLGLLGGMAHAADLPNFADVFFEIFLDVFNVFGWPSGCIFFGIQRFNRKKE